MNVFTARKSIQGEWKSNMWKEGPTHKLEKHRKNPELLTDMSVFSQKKSPSPIFKRDYIRKNIQIKDKNFDTESLL